MTCDFKVSQETLTYQRREGMSHSIWTFVRVDMGVKVDVDDLENQNIKSIKRS